VLKGVGIPGRRSLTCQRESTRSTFVSRTKRTRIAIPLASVPVTSEVIDQANRRLLRCISGSRSNRASDPVEFRWLPHPLDRSRERAERSELPMKRGDGATARVGERESTSVRRAITPRLRSIVGWAPSRDVIDGPAVIEAPDTTIVLPPGCRGT